jgi:hypothetical protein
MDFVIGPRLIFLLISVQTLDVWMITFLVQELNRAKGGVSTYAFHIFMFPCFAVSKWLNGFCYLNCTYEH